jgi:hypothetical protein
MYPEIIAELTKAEESNRLGHFDLSFFMEGPPLKKVYDKNQLNLLKNGIH